MEWREQSSVSCEEAFSEAQRWIEAVTKKTFGSNNFRSELENGVLLCDLINRIKPGVVRRVNRLPTPIAGLDNLNVFLRACGKLGLKEAQLFHPGDLQDLSTRVTVKHEETCRRLKNVLITIFWLGRKAQSDRLYDGPYLNFKAFEGLLGTALYKALQDTSSQKGGSIRDSGFGDRWYSEREELNHLRAGGGGGGRHRRDDSSDSLDSLGSRPHSVSSEATFKGSSEGCCSDTEVESVFRMATDKDSKSYRRSLVLTPKTGSQFNQFLPTKDKQPSYVPAPLRKKRAERNEENRRSWTTSGYAEDEGTLTSLRETNLSPEYQADSQVSCSALPAAHLQSAYDYESGSDSDSDRPDPDLVLDDLASRRFHSPSPAAPTNFALPISPQTGCGGGPWPKVSMSSCVAPLQNVSYLSSSSRSEAQSPQQSSVKVDHNHGVSTDSLFREIYGDSEDEDDEEGYADPIQDDLYTRKMGVKPQSPCMASYDKFLPKFWTPDEDVHIQKIKLGSQKRPWYKKMQGFSRKKSASSSDDSDCDTSPWLSPVPPSSGPSHPSSHTPSATAETTLVVGKSPHVQAHIPLQRPKIHPPLLETPPLVFAPVDPTSGPRLIKCQKWPLLGRQDPREPPDPVDYESILPDLENDDMFTRRTLAFQSNPDLVMKKTNLSSRHRRYTSEPQLNIIIQQQNGRGTEEADFPNIEQDDVVYRREKIQQERPLSGAPDNYTPMPIPEPWALPPELKARLLCPPCPLSLKTDTSTQNVVKMEQRPETDDMLIRKMGNCLNQSLAGSSMTAPSVPSFCSEGDLQKMEAIREASQIRYKKRKMVERQQETQESLNGSKSTSDLDSNTSVARLQRYEELQKYREQVKDSEDKWQDDLSKWKSRRRSVNSDIVKKKEERDQVEQVTTTSSRRSRTFREMQEERDNRSRLSSLDYLKDDDDAFDRPVVSPRSRTLPARSYTIDTPYSSGSSASHLKEEEPPSAFPATGRASSPLTTHSIDRVDAPAGRKSPTSISSNRSSYQSSAAVPSQKSPVLLRSRSTKTEENAGVVSSSTSLQRLPQPSRPLSSTRSQVEPSSFSGSQFKQPQLNTMEPNPPAVSRVSASLPRSYQRLDTARLSSVVTPRPFGAQASRISSLSRNNPMDNSQKPINGEVNASKKSLVPSRYHQFMTPEDEEQSSSAHSSEDEEEESGKEDVSTSSTQIVSNTQSISPVLPQVRREAPVILEEAKESSQESRCEMRISLNQKPNSSRDFGFQATWDSTGARITSVQPGSPAQMCQMQPGDEVLTVNGHKVAELSYTEWKCQLEEALQEGSLVMDISREGQNTWDRNQPSLPFRSHKTLNLTSMDHPILLGSTETNPIKPSLDFTSRVPSASLQTSNILTHQVVDVASNGVNGGFGEESVTMRNKESEPISLKNLKRRSEFFEKGGPEATMPEIPVPSITASSRWSWDPEEERRRQEKWQKEQERLLQEKYKRDQEKLQEEWERAQEEIAQHSPSSLEVNDQTVSLRSSESPFNQPTSLLWEAEEDREMKLEQERQRQAEERRKREEEERELQQLREERARRERQEEEERKRREEEELQWQREKEEEEMKRREEELQWQREREEEAERRRKEEEELRWQRERQEEAERRKREEEELRWQRQREEEEERRKREEEELRWQRRREEEEAERRRKEEEELRWQRRREEEEERRRQEAEQQRRERERVMMEQQQQQQQQQWAGGSPGFVSPQPLLSFTDRTKSKSSPQLDEVDTSQPRGAYVQTGSLAHYLLEEQLRRSHDSLALSERAASELELERRHILSAMRYREPERVTGSGLAERRGLQSVSQAELDRQQILNEMKKKAPLLTDNSWIRQRSASSASNKESDIPPMRRGESLDNLNNSWRSSWTPRSNSHVPNYARPHSALSGRTSFFGGGGGSGPQRPASTLPSTYSMSAMRGRAGTPTSAWSPPSPSPTTSPEPCDGAQLRNRSVSGKKICTFCENPLGKGAAMIIESLGLCYHLTCFKCFDCKSDLGGSEAGAEVRIRNKQLYCNNCYMGFKSNQPTSM